MQSWDLRSIDTPGGTVSPVVLHSDEARAVLIALDPGQSLGDHSVKERAHLCVIEGSVRVECGGETLDATPGTYLTFEPEERHSLLSTGGARILLVLAPWPGEGHYSAEEAEVSLPQ